uniref:Secreted protein n=1 Tax=Heterorhabditis bacteriophora TaxID=37862 RepID=A0A1I7WT65_HETBA
MPKPEGQRAVVLVVVLFCIFFRIVFLQTIYQKNKYEKVVSAQNFCYLVSFTKSSASLFLLLTRNKAVDSKVINALQQQSVFNAHK